MGDGVDAPRRHLRAKVTVSSCHLKEASMEQTITIGLDIAKNVFQSHGADAAGHVLFRKRLMRSNGDVDAHRVCLRRDVALRSRWR